MVDRSSLWSARVVSIQLYTTFRPIGLLQVTRSGNQVCNEQHHIVPFPGISSKWYERQNELAIKNAAREK